MVDECFFDRFYQGRHPNDGFRGRVVSHGRRSVEGGKKITEPDIFIAISGQLLTMRSCYICIIFFVLFLFCTGGYTVSGELARDYYKNGTDALFVYTHGFGGSESLTLSNFWFDRALEIDPDYEDAWFDKGKVLLLQGEFHNATVAFNRTLSLNPQYQDAWAYNGSALVYLYRFSDALEAFDKELENYPSSGYALEQKGNTLYVLGRYEEALEVFNESLRVSLPSETILTSMGSALKALGRYDEAMACFDMALKIKPGFVQAQEEKKSIQHLVNSSAGPDESGGVAGNETVDEIHSLLVTAKNLEGQGKYLEAVQAYDKALILDPKNPDAQEGKDKILESLRRPDNEVDNLTTPDSGSASHQELLNRGEILMEEERYEEAADTYQQILMTDPGNTEALSGLGQAFYHTGRYEEALEVSDQVLKLDPENTVAMNGKGIILSQLGRYDEALTSFGEALDIDPYQTDILLNQAALLTELGRYDEAVSSYNQVLKIDPKNPEANEGLLTIIGMTSWIPYE
jgi:tetratricopeptide (TPR) repeat protein